jgi:glycosyltransferase involved in cell wall biosynthesis
MRILIVNKLMGTAFGGGEAFDYNASVNLSKRGHSVTILTSGIKNENELSRLGSDIKIVRLQVPYLRNFSYKLQSNFRWLSAFILHFDMLLFEVSAFFWLFFRKKIKNFDVAQCCSMFILPKLIILFFSKPVVSWLPGPPSRFTKWLLSSLMRNPLFGLFTHGSPEWSLNDSGFERDRNYSVIEPGVELSVIDSTNADRGALRASIGIAADQLLGITTARLVPIKNHALLLDAIAIAKARGAEWNWIFIGNGPSDHKLKKQARELGIASQVHFLGYQTQPNVHQWLAVADLFALTSEYENFSIATLEAMAHRLPVIGTQVGYLQYLIEEAKAGLIVPPDQAEFLAVALTKMTDPCFRLNFSCSSRTYVERLDWPLIAVKLENYYCSLVDRTIQ